MMNPGMIFCKTEAGRGEVAQRSGATTPLQRRVLIVVDGKKSVNDLGAFVRVGELDEVLQHLLQAGLIEASGSIEALHAPAAPGFAAAHATQVPRAATSPEEFKKVREQASRYVATQLGDAGEPICTAIERCDSPAELRKLLRGIEIFIGQRLSPEVTQAFARHFGALLL